MKGSWLEALEAQLLISMFPARPAEKRCCSPASLFQKTSVFFPALCLILSQFTQGMDIPIFWGSNIMTALDINVLAVPPAVVFQNNFTVQLWFSLGIAEGFSSRGGERSFIYFLHRKTLAVVRRLLYETRTIANPCGRRMTWEMPSNRLLLEMWGLRVGKVKSQALAGEIACGFTARSGLESGGRSPPWRSHR